VGAQDGDGTNRATACETNKAAGVALFCSLEAQASVKVKGGVFTHDACLLGKVFIDCNRNHIQDPEELGIPGVRIYMEDGTNVLTDVEGKYNLCGLKAQTHVLQLDEISLPYKARMMPSSNRNAGEGNSLFVDLTFGELHRADFIEGSCSSTVLDQVKARRATLEVQSGAVERERQETDKKRGNEATGSAKAQLIFKSGGRRANQSVPQPRGNNETIIEQKQEGLR
jgi:hypothetical protein